MSTAVQAFRMASVAFAASCLSGCTEPNTDLVASDQSVGALDAVAEQQSVDNSGRLRVLTYNTALAPAFEPWAAERTC
jgi:hypothetical protein